MKLQPGPLAADKEFLCVGRELLLCLVIRGREFFIKPGQLRVSTDLLFALRGGFGTVKAGCLRDLTQEQRKKQHKDLLQGMVSAG